MPDTMRRGCAASLAAGYRRIQIKVGTGVERGHRAASAPARRCSATRRCSSSTRTAGGRRRTRPGWSRPSTTWISTSSSRARRSRSARRSGARSRRPLILDESLFELGRHRARARGGRRRCAAAEADALRRHHADPAGARPRGGFGLPLTVEDSGGGDVVTAAVAHVAARSRRSCCSRATCRARCRRSGSRRGTPTAVPAARGCRTGRDSGSRSTTRRSASRC